MLSAVLHGKKLGTGFAGTRLKIGETQGAEDVLTASVFERIAYLPDDVFIRFIQNLFNFNNQITANPLSEITFWASWQNQSGCKVEPDVILKFGGRTVIVEAKRYDNVQQQYAYQLANEISTAYLEGITNPILLTVGGMSDYKRQNIDNLKKQIDSALQLSLAYSFYAISWQQLYSALDFAITVSHLEPLERLLSDIREAYAWHGIRHQPRQWLENINRDNCNINFEAIPNSKIEKKSWKNLKPIYLTHETFSSFLG